MDAELAKILIKEDMDRLEKDEPVTYTLVLDEQLLGKEGVHQILDTLILHPNVYSSIHYSHEGGGDAEGTKIAAALKASTTLTNLDICGNKFSSVTAIALIDALRTNTSLDTLNIDGSFSDGWEREILGAISSIHGQRLLCPA